MICFPGQSWIPLKLPLPPPSWHSLRCFWLFVWGQIWDYVEYIYIYIFICFDFVGVDLCEAVSTFLASTGNVRHTRQHGFTWTIQEQMSRTITALRKNGHLCKRINFVLCSCRVAGFSSGDAISNRRKTRTPWTQGALKGLLDRRPQ